MNNFIAEARLQTLPLPGGGHLLSKKALRKLVENIFAKDNPELCDIHRDGFADDMITGAGE